MSPDVDVLLERARAWLAEDPDAQTRAELEQVIADVEAGDAEPPPTWPTGSAAPSSSAPPACAARWAPAPTG